MRCLLTIPAFRESDRLPQFLTGLLEQFDRDAIGCEVVVVDDGSGDREEELLRKLCASLQPRHPRLRLPICLGTNLGKGAAVRRGWASATLEHDWVGFVDADGAIPASEVVRMLQRAGRAPEPTAFFGSRVKMLGRQIQRNPLRHFSGRVFAFLVGNTISPDVYDSQCGIKLVPAATYRTVAPWLAEDGFCFDVELLAALMKTGIRLEEVPIDWFDQPGSRVSFFRDAWRMFLGVRRVQERSAGWRLP